MSSELLASGVDNLKGHLAGAFNVLTGSSGDYTDLGIGRKFGGAAAAYSLRDVGAMNGPVVRVRRDSDNSEQDFSALAVPYIPEWCNRQVIKPLDVKALQSDGRTGDFIIAKAAYSLRSLGDRQAIIPNDESSPLNEDTDVPASGKYVVQVRRNVDGTIKSFTADEVTDGTLVSFVNESFTSSLPLDVQGSAAAAYSLRNLSSTYSGAVVNVRRSSDDTTRDFTADSITNGDLLTFVNEDVTIYQSDFSAGVNGFTQTSTTTLTGNQDGVSDEAGTTKDNVLKAVKASDAQGYIQRDQGVVAGLSYTVSGTFFAPTSNTSVDGIMIKDGLSGSALSNFPSGYLTSGGLWTDFSFSYTATASGNQRINFGISSLASNPTSSSTGSTGDIFYISDLKFVETTSNGHVATWYDQSGNSNNATQTTADNQPKIVEGGILNKDSNNNISVKFDSSKEHHLNNTTLPSSFTSSNTTFSDFTVQEPFQNNATGAVFGFGSTVSSNVRLNKLVHSGGNYGYQGYGSTAGFQSAFDTASYSANDVFLGSGLRVGTDLDIFKNSADADMNNTFDTGTLAVNTFAIGAYVRSTGVTSPFNGNITELIIYASDISAKRRAIEESIATNYSVTLASFSRDGMVRTWYDQSVTDQGGATGNAHHAIQATAANQPTIVSNGSLVADQGIDFDDASEHSLVATSGSGMEEKLSVFSTSVRDSTGFTVSLSNSSNASKYFAISEGGSNSTLNSRNELTVQASPSVSGNARLTFGLTTGDTVTSAGALGGALTTDTTDYGSAFGSGDLDQIVIGALRTVSPSAGHYFEGRIREILVYASSATGDQTDNRGAFEANIASHYGITAIPTAADPPTVNGFVETWYDQSGNGRDVTQTTADEQPKIVNEGVLLTDGIEFDGTNDTFNTSSGLAFTSSDDLSVFSVINQDSTSGQNPVISQSDGTGTGRSFIEGKDGDITSFIGGSIQTFGTIGTTENIVTVIYDDSANTLDVFKDGSQSGSQKTSITAEAASGVLNIGKNKGNSQFFDGHINEIILYLSDQTADRTDIESNINNHYSIF